MNLNVAHSKFQKTIAVLYSNQLVPNSFFGICIDQMESQKRLSERVMGIFNRDGVLALDSGVLGQVIGTFTISPNNGRLWESILAFCYSNILRIDAKIEKCSFLIRHFEIYQASIEREWEGGRLQSEQVSDYIGITNIKTSELYIWYKLV